MITYPLWRYFPAYSPPPDWTDPLVGIFAAHKKQIDSEVTHKKRMESNDVLAALADDLRYLRAYEIDAFQADLGLALEVEAGRATMGNAIYRDLIQASLMVDARFLAMAVPVEYRYGRNQRRNLATRRPIP